MCEVDQFRRVDSHVFKLCDDLWARFRHICDSWEFEVLYTRDSSYGYTGRGAQIAFCSLLEQLFITHIQDKTS